MHIAASNLEGSTIDLEALSAGHAPELTRAALSAPEVWQYIPYRVSCERDVARLLAAALELHRTGTGLVFATRLRSSAELVGGTAIRLVDAQVPSVEIGSTWIVPRWQRTAVNSEAKYLQLRHCFETLGVARVEFKTDVRNQRSQAALRRLGARQEGVLRQHMRRHDGLLRDSVYFSIVAAEWPEVKAGLLRAPLRAARP